MSECQSISQKNSDDVKHHMHSECEGCPYHDSCLNKACVKGTCQELDSVVTINVIAHELIEVSDCPMHGGKKLGSFPSDIKAAVQYEKNLQSLVVALNTVGAVSINRTREILSSVFNIPIATGTIKNMVTRCADLLSGTYERIRQQMIFLGLIHCDETGTRVEGRTCWVHNASNQLFTFLTIDKKRGQIRELNGIEENHPEQTWATKFKELLLAMKKVKDKAVDNEKENVSYYHLHKFDKQYDEIIKLAYKENSLPESTAKKTWSQEKDQSIKFNLQT